MPPFQHTYSWRKHVSNINIFYLDGFVKSPPVCLTGKGRHPKPHKNDGFRIKPGMTKETNMTFYAFVNLSNYYKYIAYQWLRLLMQLQTNKHNPKTSIFINLINLTLIITMSSK